MKWNRKILFGILQIVSRNLKISAESRVIAGELGSLLEFVQEIFWTESVRDFIFHNGTIKHDKLLSMKEIIWPNVFYPERTDHGNGSVLKTLKGLQLQQLRILFTLWFIPCAYPQRRSQYSRPCCAASFLFISCSKRSAVFLGKVILLAGNKQKSYKN